MYRAIRSIAAGETDPVGDHGAARKPKTGDSTDEATVAWSTDFREVNRNGRD